MLLDYIDKITSACTIDVAWNHHVEAMEKFGFDRLLYGYTRFRHGQNFGSNDDVMLLSNHDREFLREFVDNGMYYHAPMFKWAAQNVGACSWSWVRAHRDQLTAEERKVQELNRKFGIIAGYSISFPTSSNRAKGAIGLVGRSGLSQDDVDDIWREHGRTILQMNNVLHLKITSLPFSTRRRPLTARQREVLEWVGDGKTVHDIAQILDVSPATVEKHLRLAREALDAETTAHAVLKASFQNHIFVMGGPPGPQRAWREASREPDNALSKGA